MFPLFALPREIRDLIYAAVLNTELPPPATPFELRETRKSLSPNWQYNCNQYSLLGPTVAAGPLLLMCTQVKTEVSELIDRLKSSRQLRYKLDVVFESEQLMHPTWTCIPALSSHVDVVEADFRIMGVKDESLGGFHTEYGPGYMTSSLLELMMNILGQKPNTKVHYLPGQPPRISVGTIRINVIRPEEPKGGFIPFDVKQDMSSVERVYAQGMMHPEDLFCWIKRMLDILINQGRNGAMTCWRHAERIFEDVERIEVGVNGVMRREWDVREIVRLRGDGEKGIEERGEMSDMDR